MREKAVHEGRNIKRIREIIDMKQDELALELNMSQQAVSQLEQKSKIDESILKDVAIALRVPVEAIRNYDEDSAISFISNNFHDQSSAVNYYPTFNSVEKWLEALDEIKKLQQEKIELYERMLKEKNEMIEQLLKK